MRYDLFLKRKEKDLYKAKMIDLVIFINSIHSYFIEKKRFLNPLKILGLIT